MQKERSSKEGRKKSEELKKKKEKRRKKGNKKRKRSKTTRISQRIDKELTLRTKTMSLT